MKLVGRKFGLVGLVLGLVFVFMTSAASAEPVVKEWRIPFLIFLTGPFAGFGEQLKWATDQAVKEVNEAGGAAGRPMVIEYHDTALDPAKAAAEMSKVVENSLIIWGPVADIEVKAALPLAIRQGAFCMNIACGTDVSLEFQPWTVHLFGRYEEFIPPPMQGWIKRNPDIKKVAQFTWPQHPTWIDMARNQRVALEAVGVEVVDVECAEGVDMSSVVVKAMSKEPDGYVLTLGPVEAGKIVKELDKRGVTEKRRIMIFPTAYDPALLEVGKGYLDGVYHYNLVNFLSENPAWQRLFAEYKLAYPEFPSPTIGVPIFYDEVYMTKAAIEDLGLTGDPAKLAEERIMFRDYIRNLKDFPGCQYTYSIVDGIAKSPGTLFIIREEAPDKLEFVETYWPQ